MHRIPDDVLFAKFFPPRTILRQLDVSDFGYVIGAFMHCSDEGVGNFFNLELGCFNHHLGYFEAISFEQSFHPVTEYIEFFRAFRVLRPIQWVFIVLRQEGGVRSLSLAAAPSIPSGVDVSFGAPD